MTYQWLKIPNLREAVERFLQNDKNWELVPVEFEDYFFSKTVKRVQYRCEKLHLRRKGWFGSFHFSIYISPDMICVWLGGVRNAFRVMDFVNDKILEG